MNIQNETNLGDFLYESFIGWCKSALPSGFQFQEMRPTGSYSPKEMIIAFRDIQDSETAIEFVYDLMQSRLIVCDANDKYTCVEDRDLNIMNARRMVDEILKRMNDKRQVAEEESVEEVVAPPPGAPVMSPIVLSSLLRKIAHNIDSSRLVDRAKVANALNDLVRGITR